MKLYPLQFKPIFKSKIWGGDQLNTLKKINPPINQLGESWEISVVPDDESIITNGNYKGQSLTELIEQYPLQLLGATSVNRFGNQFPLLIKYIDAAQDLSIQVHPDDSVAQKKHNSFGKTEMWYIMHADEGARLIMGFNEDCDKDAFAKAIQEKSLLDLLNKQQVKTGDAFFIKPGLIHAIGGGITLAEIQQSSDITYRVYDFDRKDDEGNTRELHIQDTIDVADYNKVKGHHINYNPSKTGSQNLATNRYFKTDYVSFDDHYQINPAQLESFVVLMNVGDTIIDIEVDDENVTLKPVETVLLPASLVAVDLHSTAGAKVLQVSIS